MDLIYLFMDQTHAAEGTSTTQDVARAIGVSCSTLYRWLRLGFIAEPAFVQVGRVRIRAWRRDDVMRALIHRKRFYYWTRDQIKRGAIDGKQPGAQRPSGDVQAGGARPSEDTRA
jgi:hypothetical protein